MKNHKFLVNRDENLPMNLSIIPQFKGKRWLKILLRSIHLVGFSGVFAYILFDEPQVIYWVIMLTSGLGLLIVEAFSNLLWFVQVRALFMYIKLVLLGVVFLYPSYAFHCFIIIIMMSGIIAHAPSSVRYFSFIHFKKVKSVHDIKG